MLRSRLPQIIAELSLRMDAIARQTAELVEQRAKDRAPVESGKLHDAIHVQREGIGEYGVIAGDNDVFYGHLIEFGTVRTPARPFLVPASEETRAQIQAIGIKSLRNL